MTAGITEYASFGPLTVAYDSRVLTPRPWTFAQSRWAADLAPTLPRGPILELCAGAGHIGLAAAVLADRDLIQIEADPVAAEYAVANAERTGWAGRTTVHVGRLEDAFGATAPAFPLIIADPPYLSTEATARWPDDPPLAIDGGADGLRVVRACLRVASRVLGPGGAVLLQVAGGQQDAEVLALLEDDPGLALVRTELRVTDAERAIALLRRAPEEASEASRPAAEAR